MSERERKKIRPLSSFVHRPKCVWCMDQHTKPSACGRRLTLNKNKRLLMENKRHSAENGSVTILFDMVPARHAKPCKTLKYVSVNFISWIIKGAKQWLISHIPTLVVNLFSGTGGLPTSRCPLPGYSGDGWASARLGFNHQILLTTKRDKRGWNNSTFKESASKQTEWEQLQRPRFELPTNTTQKPTYR